ncbi:alpha/beta hydrolase [Pseudomonas putida]|uniref:alpha/beta fold hydrolase n=1 Tax=Pseudomonas putida TaxID=303 RepID=UPI0023635F6A|nr:alpha/beta hydrolase [Pseudomonas putida]MDD2068671.1 alpha/beta hydrolase [Pseudomonas putida]HDS1738604.1 alpha/beta hydrolase [Pseudomonas putida]
MHQFEGASGLRLAADIGGEAGLTPVVLLHGGGQTRHSWGNVFSSLVTAGYHVISYDARGHGDSDWDSEGDYTLDAMVEDLHAVLCELPSTPILVGASMGGMTALAAAGEAQHEIARALVMVDVTPRINAQGAQQIMAFMREHADGFESIEAASEAVANYLPHRTRPRDASGLSRNLRQREGRWFWHWDPQLMPGSNQARAHSQDRLEAAARSLSMPTLLIRGDKSNIVTEQEATRFLNLVPHAEYLTVHGAGHMVVGDRNDAFNRGILDFISRTMPPQNRRDGGRNRSCNE